MEFRFGEVNVICTDIERSRHFYTKVLGFEFDHEEGGGVHLKCGEQQVLLLPFAKEKVADVTYCHRATISFDLYTDHIDAAYQHFINHGAEFAKEQDKSGDYFFVKDPDGNVLEIVPN